jgi:FkbM family methyltransferase
LALNDCVNVVQVIESALGNESGLADIVLTNDFSGGGTVGNATIMSQVLYEEKFAQFGRSRVKIDTLDRIWSGEGRIDVVKVDVEGNETQFLEGGRNTIAAHTMPIVRTIRPAERGLLSYEHVLDAGANFASVTHSLALPTASACEWPRT